MALSARQNRLYKDRADVWELTTPFDANGVALTPQWTLISAGVRCHFQINPNLDSPGAFGRYLESGQFVLDILHLGEHERIDSDMIVVNRTLDPDGSKTENYGFAWRVRGPARNISRRPGRHMQKRSVYIYEEKQPPADVLAHLDD